MPKHPNHKSGRRPPDFGKKMDHDAIDRKKSSINWDEVRAEYEARLQWEYEQGRDPIELKGKPPKKPGNNPDGAPRRYDHKEIVRLYEEEQWSGSQIAKKLGAHDSTIYGILRKHGVTARPYYGAANGRKQ